jgi:hypothetical protein
MKSKKQLIIGKKAKQKLSRPQQTFNRLIRKLENLRNKKEKTEKLLSEKLDYYGKFIHPLEKQNAEITAHAIKTLYRLYHEQEKLTASDKEVLIDIIAGEFENLFSYSNQEPDDEIKKIFEFVEGENFDEAAESDFQAMKTDMQETFKEMGFEIDLDDFTSDLSEEEIVRKMFEKVNDAKEQIETEETTKKKRKKTKRQIAKEERERQVEEAKNKNISAIYKQLAKVFHPDLEQDKKRREEKEVLMKQLTIAYKEGDLHTLLRLELEWLHKEEDNLEKLSEDKLKIYNQALKDQVEELEMQIHFASEHPRYLPLQRYIRFFGVESINLEFEKEKLETNIKLTKRDLAELDSEKPLKKLKAIIRQVKKDLKNQQMFEIDFDKFLNRF